MKLKDLFIIIILVANSCSLEYKKESNLTDTTIAIIFEDYYEFKSRINPIEATKGGNYEYNDYIANYISDDYQNDLIKEYKNFLNRLNEIDETSLSAADKLSMEVMKWDCMIKLEGLQNPIVVVTSPMYNLPSFELTPLTQIQSLHLYVAQLASGGSVHPFNSTKDYEDWLKRVDDYIIFLDTCISMMREGISKKIVLPSVLTNKTIIQLEEFITKDINEHLFYRPIISPKKLIPR